MEPTKKPQLTGWKAAIHRYKVGNMTAEFHIQRAEKLTKRGLSEAKPLSFTPEHMLGLRRGSGKRQKFLPKEHFFPDQSQEELTILERAFLIKISHVNIVQVSVENVSSVGKQPALPETKLVKCMFPEETAGSQASPPIVKVQI